jgi:DNA ligase-1
MKTFASLVNALDSTNKTGQKLEALEKFLNEAEESDKIWLLALFTGRRPKRGINTTLLKKWAMEETGLPEWLFLESYAAVGDLGETIALILPNPVGQSDTSLAEWMGRIAEIKNQSESEKHEFVLNAWRQLSVMERFIFNKLLGGSFRLGVSSQLLINALSRHYALEPTAVAHSIMGDWEIGSVSFDDLIKGTFTDTQLSKPYPFCLAYPLESEPGALGDEKGWQAEFKWDGIRGQFIKRDDQVFIWSRGEELVTEQFPELKEELLRWSGNFVLDGEILAYREQEILNFSELQKRLNRKNLTRKLLEEQPVVVFAYDLLEWEGIDWRARPLVERRRQLENLLAKHPSGTITLSSALSFKSWSELAEIRQKAREVNSEGLMLKRGESPYHTGRKKGDWWKWKLDPLTIDAVLIYAQKGSGRRSGYYTDYTFAVRDGEKLVTVAKAYSGLTDAEIQEVSRFVNRNSIEKFGPVRTVKPELVFEIAFEGIGFSSRHKSGVALRFPRILRWRKDKTLTDIDDIESVKMLIK